MAYRTETGVNDRMKNLFFKFSTIMAIEAEVWQLLAKQSLMIGPVGLMTGQALRCFNRRMNHLQSHNFILTVTSETDFRNLIKKKSPCLRSVRRMTPETLTIVDRSVNPVPSGEEVFIVAHETEIRRLCYKELINFAAVRFVT